MPSTTTLLGLAAEPPRAALRPMGHLQDRSHRALSIAAIGWASVAVLGQLIFAGYVLGFYGRSAAAGQFERWRQVLPQGWVPGDVAANLLLSLHLLFTVLIVVGGAAQLLPALRRAAPTVHRWNGRLYLVSALLMGGSGLVMLFTRRPVGDGAQHLGVGLNGVLIVAFAALAWRAARARHVDAHRRWALRLFLVVGGVWFFRLGLSAWLVLNQGPAGFDPETFTGPFLTFLAFAQTLLPLAVLQLYFEARHRAAASGRVAMAAALWALTLLTALGIASATMILWWPRLH